MKGRRMLQSLAILPAMAAAPPPAPAQSSATAPAPETMPKLGEAAPDAVSDGVTRFFSHEQFAALENLARLIMPVEGEVPLFLDFLIGQSNAKRQTLYRDGLD